MKYISILIFLLSSQVLFAEDLTFAFEGSAKQRERLKDLQGSAAPEFDLTEWLNSKKLNLKDLKGKVVVLDFWATWCGPCIASIPKNNKIANKYKDDVVFIGVCHPSGADKMKQMAKDKGINYPIAVDAKSKSIKEYKVNGYPDYYIIDKNGKIVVADCSNSKVEEVLKKLLKK